MYFDWVAEHDDVYHLGTTGAAVEKLYYAERGKLGRPAGGEIGPSEWTDVFLQAGVLRLRLGGRGRGVRRLGAQRRRRRHSSTLYGDPSAPGDDNGYAIYLAVQCTDAPWPTDWSTWRRDNWRRRTPRRRS